MLGVLKFLAQEIEPLLSFFLMKISLYFAGRVDEIIYVCNYLKNYLKVENEKPQYMFLAIKALKTKKYFKR